MHAKMSEIERMIERYGIPGRDRYDLPSSALRFPDGAHYRNEISGIETLTQMHDLVDEMARRASAVHRVIFGDSTRLTIEELRELAQIAQGAGIEVVIDPGPKAIADVGRHVDTAHGRYGGWRVRGADSFKYLIASIVRCIDAGLRGFLLYDEGALLILNKMRQNGDLPADTVLKVSYTAGYRNPAGALLLESLGANSFNPVTDLELPMLAALRQTVTIPMDIVVLGWESLGGFSRVFQSPEIVRVCSPCYLKQELGGDARVKVKYCEIIWEIVQATYADMWVSGHVPHDPKVAMPP